MGNPLLGVPEWLCTWAIQGHSQKSGESLGSQKSGESISSTKKWRTHFLTAKTHFLSPSQEWEFQTENAKRRTITGVIFWKNRIARPPLCVGHFSADPPHIRHGRARSRCSIPLFPFFYSCYIHTIHCITEKERKKEKMGEMQNENRSRNVLTWVTYCMYYSTQCAYVHLYSCILRCRFSVALRRM